MTKVKSHLLASPDIRQSPAWAKYLESIGWQIEKVGTELLYIRKIPLTSHSIIKIQHPRGPLNFKRIDELARRKKALALFIEPHNKGYNEKDYLKNGFQKTKVKFAPSATIKIDLNLSEKDLFASFSENARRNIKKAIKNNIRIEKVFPKDDQEMESFEEYYRLLKNLRKIKGFYAPGYEESKKKLIALKKNSVFLFAYEGNTPIAVIWLGFFRNTATYLQTGISRRGYELLANYLLVWEGLLLAKKLKHNVFDFESIVDPRFPAERKAWEGYSSFKKRFHGEVILYPSPWVKYYSNFGRFLFSIEEVFRKKPKKIVHSNINGNIEIGKSYGAKAIFVNGIPQSGGELGKMWSKIIDGLKKRRLKIKKCLVLGIGGGDVIRELQREFPKAKIVAVELDPVMIDLAKKEFGTTDKNLAIYQEDAFTFVERKNLKGFDLVIVDLFIGRLNPDRSRSANFLTRISMLLTGSGIVLFNSHYDKGKPNDYENLKNVSSSIFPKAEEVFKYPRNKVLLLSS